MLRGDHAPASSPEGCDPTVFAGQIVSYLRQLAEERAAATTIDATPFPFAEEAGITVEAVAARALPQGILPIVDTTPAVVPAAEAFKPFATPGMDATLEHLVPLPDRPSNAPKELHSAEAAAEAMREGTLDEERAGIEEALLSLVEKLSAEGRTKTNHAPTPEPDLTIELDELRLAMERRELEWIEELNHVELSGLDAVPRDSAARESPESTAVVGDPIDTPEAEARAPPSVARKGGAEWGKLIESLRHDLDRLDAERQHRSGTPVASHLDESRIPTSPRPSGTAEPGVRNKQRRSARPAPAIQDEWGFFDPEQCGFAALLAKLDEITEEREALTHRRA